MQELAAHDPHGVALHRGTVRGSRHSFHTSFCNFFATFAANLPPANLRGGFFISHDGDKSEWIEFKLNDWIHTSCSEFKSRLREK